MPEVLDQLALMQRNELRLRGSIRSMLTYPILLTVISSSVIATLVIFVLPRFATIFEQYDMVLPVLTRGLIALSVELKTRWWLWIPGICAALGGAIAWRMTDGGRRKIDAFFLHCAILRNVSRPLFIGRTCRMLGLLLQSGVPLLEGLRLSRNAVNNRLYKDLLDDVADSVVNGRGMGPQLLEAQIVPRSAREMLMTAERTGNLSEVAILLGAYYEEEAENRMRQAVRISEPLITVVMGAIVAVVVLSVMLPIFDLSNIASGGH
jgi:type II secretory pathway component PulF